MQIVCGIFSSTEERTNRAISEFRWSLAQNSTFWRQAICYVDPDCERYIEPYKHFFQEVVIDHEMPESVRAHKLWDCKAWWAKKAVERFGEVLFCDFDIYVFKTPDERLLAELRHQPVPRFLNVPAYASPNKVVGCGCTYYTSACDWENFLRLSYQKWHCDERAWTETLKMTQEKLLAQHFHMNPYIVDWDWLQRYPEACNDVYILHGISSEDKGKKRMLKAGYDMKQVRFFDNAESIERQLSLLSASYPRKIGIYGKAFVISVLRKIRRHLRIL